MISLLKLDRSVPGNAPFLRAASLTFCALGFAVTAHAQQAHETGAVAAKTTPQTPPSDAPAAVSPHDPSQDITSGKVSGLAVIDKVLSSGRDPVFRADGYRLQITPSTDLTFSGQLNSLADITTNVWVQYEGKFSPSGDIAVSKVTFVPAGPSKFVALAHLKVAPATVELPNTTPPAQGAHKEKLRYSDSESRFRAIDDPALQARVQRIGMSLVPAYQKALSDDQPSKIRFQFYAVDNDKLRGEVCSPDGLILLPKPVLERLKTDDQLAAILADGITANFQRQAVRLSSATRAAVGAEIAGGAAGLVIPGVWPGTWFGSNIADGRLALILQRQRNRMTLALMSDAGYDLKQAPEAWRLLTPKSLPSDTSSLKYPEQSLYLQKLIEEQYNQPSQGLAR
jgi:hypothetical protein